MADSRLQRLRRHDPSDVEGQALLARDLLRAGEIGEGEAQLALWILREADAASVDLLDWCTGLGHWWTEPLVRSAVASARQAWGSWANRSENLSDVDPGGLLDLVEESLFDDEIAFWPRLDALSELVRNVKFRSERKGAAVYAVHAAAHLAHGQSDARAAARRCGDAFHHAVVSLGGDPLRTSKLISRAVRDELLFWALRRGDPIRLRVAGRREIGI